MALQVARGKRFAMADCVVLAGTAHLARCVETSSVHRALAENDDNSPIEKLAILCSSPIGTVLRPDPRRAVAGVRKRTPR